MFFLKSLQMVGTTSCQAVLARGWRLHETVLVPGADGMPEHQVIWIQRAVVQRISSLNKNILMLLALQK